MMKPIIWVVSISTFFAFFTQNVHADPSALFNECEEKTRLINIASSIKDATRTFANEKVQIWHLDTNGEPACCSHHLAITFTEPVPETGDRFCTQLSMSKNDGFYNLSLKEITSEYDVKKGLSLAIPVKFYDNEQDYKIKLEIQPKKYSVLISSID